MHFIRSCSLKPIAGLFGVLLIGLVPGWLGAESVAQSPESAPATKALDYAFRFASAIDPDPKDKARAQQMVVQAYAEVGELDQAIRYAGKIDGWRRGVAYADLATLLALEGEPQRARELIKQAEEVRRTIDDWQNPRIAAHVAGALAVLGDVEPAETISSSVAAGDPRQYAGRAAATAATALAADGRFDEALERLAAFEGERDIEVSWWRTSGYLAIAKTATLSRDQRRQALDAARRSADAVPGGKRIDALQQIADGYAEQGASEAAIEALETAAVLLDGVSDEMPMKVPLEAMLGRAMARVGETDRAIELLEAALTGVPRNMPIEQPAIYATIASGYLAAGDEKRSRQIYDKALGTAEGLVNARPRALAVVSIGISMGRDGINLDAATLQRLDKLYRGLTAPW